MNNTPQPQPTGSSDDELRDGITSIIYGADWKQRDIADAFKPDVEAAMQLIKADRQKALQRANRTLRLAALKHKGEMAKAVTAARIDPFDFVGPCEPECSSERHAYHQGQWDMATRIKEFTNQEEIE